MTVSENYLYFQAFCYLPSLNEFLDCSDSNFQLTMHTSVLVNTCVSLNMGYMGPMVLSIHKIHNHGGDPCKIE